jgi:uncharacterized repeat protein (TIGR03803 family)
MSLADRFTLTALTALLGSALVGQGRAQSFSVLLSFGEYDGGNPGGLILSSNTLYGTTAGNPLGVFGQVGSVFKLNTDGSGVAYLHQFGGSGEGSYPQSGLLLASNTLYGTATSGGSGGNGTVFAINTDGTGYTNLYSFTATLRSSPQTNTDGAAPYGGLVLSGNTLYGTAQQGGSSGNGTVFKLNTDGTGFRTLYSFAGPSNGDPYAIVTNADGAFPLARLFLSGNVLYGTASGGGAGGSGTVFRMNTDGTGFTNLHSFAALDATTGTNSEGASPTSALILSGNALYGTATSGGSSSNGTVFKVNIDGTAFTVLHHFMGASDGATPEGGLLLSGNTLYGTAYYGGSAGKGTVFALQTDGTGFKVLHNLGANFSTEVFPAGSLVLSKNILYGTFSRGGLYDGGGVFNLALTAPQLSISRAGADVILAWPTSYAGFDFTGYILQSTTNLAAPAWTTVAPVPMVINGQNVVTNPIGGKQEFFRLSQ